MGDGIIGVLQISGTPHNFIAILIYVSNYDFSLLH